MGMLTQAMYIPADVLEQLSAVSGIFWSSWEHEAVICDAIRAYIKPRPAEAVHAAAPTDTGYQWKQLFLPEGTRLRASFGRQPYFANVEGAEIKCDGASISPSGFANLRGSGNRNAWKAVWLRFPGSAQWVLAHDCRALQKAAAERLFNPAASEPKAATATTTTTTATGMLQLTRDPNARPGIESRAPADYSSLPAAAIAAPRKKPGKRRKRHARPT